MEKEKDIILSAEQIEQQEKLDDLFVLIKAISKRVSSDITGDFMEFLDDHKLNREDFYLAMLFVAIISGGKLPNKEDYESIDTNDEKIEALIRDLAKIEPNK